MKIKRILFFLLLLVQSVFLLAENASFYTSAPSHCFTKRIGTEQGLTNPGVTAIHTSSDGVVWIGTRYLLNKYVNGELTNYNEQETGGSYITMLFEDKENQMWIGTERSLMRYEGDTDTFREIYSERINCAVEYKGKYYFAGKGNIVRFNPEDGSTGLIPSPTTHVIKAFVFTDNVLLFVDKYDGLFYYNVLTGNLKKLSIPEIEKTTILSACFDDFHLYLGVFYKGVFKIDINGGIVKRYLVENYPNLRLEAICDISKIGQKICLATDGSGICVIEQDVIKPLTSIPDYSELTSLPSSTTIVVEDSFSNIWMGSVHNGVIGIKKTRITGSNSYISLNKSEGRNFAILSLAKTSNTLWLGTEGGLFAYSPETRKFFLSDNFKNDIVSSLVPLSNDRILVSSYCKGLYMLEVRNGNKSRFIIKDAATNQKEIFSGYNIELGALSDDEILITGENVYRYNCKTHSTDILYPDYGVPAYGLHLLYVSKDRSEAYVYSENVFCRIDLLRNRISLIDEPKEYNKINTAVFVNGKIYFGTDNGLNTYCVETGEYGTVNSGLFKRVTHVCLKDEKSIWITSNNSLYSLDVASNIVEVFDEAEGFSTKEVQASEKLGGNFYFGGIDNISEVPFNISSSINNMPSISLLGVNIDDDKQPLRKNGTVRIPYKHNSVDIQFVLKGEDPFRRTMLKYSISGPESSSVETHSYTYSLSRLSHGRYSVSVSYLMSDGLWSEPVESVSLLVNEPLWQTEWFLVLVALIFTVSSLFVINRNKTKSQIKLQSAIQENRDIEQEKRYRFIHSVESELAKPIAQIKKLSRTILEEEDNSGDKFKKKIEKIYNSSAYLEKMIELSIKQERPVEEENPILVKFNKLIDDRIADQNLDVALLVKEMAMSRTALYDKIKELSGMGINEYIQNRRLILARKYLIETDMSMSEISDELGFSSPKYFSEIFKKSYEISPREFKKRIMEKPQE